MQITVMLILGFSFFLFISLGIPISVCIALSSFLALLPLYDPFIATQIMGHAFTTALDNFGFLAIPFFVLAGNIMNQGGIARRLIHLAQVTMGPVPGALAYCNVLANLLFGSVSGSAAAAAAAVGSSMGPIQKKEGYDPAFSAAVNIASCSSGLLVPPSNILILYALVSGGTSIVSLFVAGYIPGLIMSLSAVLVILAQRKNLPRGKGEYWSGQIFLKALLDALPSLLMVVVVMGGLIKGIFTATEASVVSTAYALILSAFYKEMAFRDLRNVLVQSVITTSVILFLVTASSTMSWVFSIAEIPGFVSEGLLGLSNEPWVILLIMNILLLIVGTFMDMSPIVLIFTPIFLPVAIKLGIDPVHFGIIMIFNTCIGINTPPVGNALFVGCGVSGVGIDRVVPKLIPFFLMQCLALVLIVYFPELSLWLPRILGLL